MQLIFFVNTARIMRIGKKLGLDPGQSPEAWNAEEMDKPRVAVI